jgi:hypothetical protein
MLGAPCRRGVLHTLVIKFTDACNAPQMGHRLDTTLKGSVDTLW